ncbi:MAG: hypothetical protein J6B62_05000 [Bacteroidales bacterium]|nr:hypothetical protein [Bacteroidales bacterium]
MTANLHRISLCTVMLLASVFILPARPHAIGGSFSLNGAGVVYRQELRRDVFYEVGLEVDYGYSVFVSRALPGAWVRYGYNMVFAEKEYEEGTLRFYGGPGVAAGYIRDAFSSREGLAGGLTGTVGMEYSFKVPVVLSLSVTPCLGLMYSRDGNGRQLDFYSGGVSYAFLPSIGIKYCF